jgi:hypothetical protein
MSDNDWRDWFRSWHHSGYLAHPYSSSGGGGAGRARLPSRNYPSRRSGPPHPDSPAGRHFSWGDALLDVGLHMPGRGRSILLWLVSKFAKVGQPFSTALLRHYVEGTGEPFDLSEIGPIPGEWQVWIMKSTKAKIGRHHLDPYHAKPFIPDLKNALGHFDVIVSSKEGSATKVYQIEKDPYHFGFRPNDLHRTGQHGFELPHMSNAELRELEALLPTGNYHNPGGFTEGFEIRAVHGKWTVYVPQEVTARAGKPFKVTGRFER